MANDTYLADDDDQDKSNTGQSSQGDKPGQDDDDNK